jgi:hypothetical protein
METQGACDIAGDYRLTAGRERIRTDVRGKQRSLLEHPYARTDSEGKLKAYAFNPISSILCCSFLIRSARSISRATGWR